MCISHDISMSVTTDIAQTICTRTRDCRQNEQQENQKRKGERGREGGGGGGQGGGQGRGESGGDVQGLFLLKDFW